MRDGLVYIQNYGLGVITKWASAAVLDGIFARLSDEVGWSRRNLVVSHVFHSSQSATLLTTKMDAENIERS